MNLPAEGVFGSGALALPAGKHVRANRGHGRPVAWVTELPVPAAGRVWAALSDASSETGLVPFLLGHLLDEVRRPWDSQELADPLDAALVDEFSPREILRQEWKGKTHEGRSDHGESADFLEGLFEEIAPFSRLFPGLADPSQATAGRERLDQALDSLGPQRIGLVPASRPADVLPLVGWIPYGGPEEAVLEIAAVLRSWEDRFGARLLKLGFHKLSLLVSRPPADMAQAQGIAAEHWAFCDECADRGLTEIALISDYVMESVIWTFWWD